MSNLCCQLLRMHSKRLIRYSQPVRHKVGQGAYEGEGKTTVTILNRDADYGLMIDKISMQGFKLNLGVSIMGPMIIFPRTVIGWNITTVEDINENSMTLFKVLDPKPDIMLLGLNKPYPRETKFIKDFQSILQGLDIRHEILSVEKACTTFNFLNAERRYAVAALLPPDNLDDLDMDSINDMALRRTLYEGWQIPKDPRFENPNTLEEFYFPSEETKKMFAEVKKRRAKRAAKKKEKDLEDDL
ncbi:NADH dehydrogenase [ubiquinone] 1 alpha subcomplex assembly factor 3 [Diachasma alloeum]|uniref:NADH dehydrogenase [ubiquinone] 1 alpha subcomplex assembly factor 3 n=1 Tax=Diachasma alloeum TaxID=454923 RepID=UPI0007381058|nr:NADH dehydrogenase [ubiquinone] 1 alpha subcomplex assembly factor 3 [Diachasma alloeum]